MIAVEQLDYRIGTFRLDAVSFRIPRGQYAVLMGKTGSGKTTLIECLCGLRRAQRGRILLAGRDVTRLPAAQRGIGYVPQDGALFPTMTVREQLEFPLRIRHWPRASIEERVTQLAQQMEIPSLLDRKPQGLSGGEAQRVALARALSFRPDVLVLDEPLSALDEETRGQIVDLLRRVQQEAGVTAIHVTHHRVEATQLADVLLRIDQGKVTEAILQDRSPSGPADPA